MLNEYLVIRVYNHIEPNVVFSTNDAQDAKYYARIMHNKDGAKYAVLNGQPLYVTED